MGMVYFSSVLYIIVLVKIFHGLLFFECDKKFRFSVIRRESFMSANLTKKSFQCFYARTLLTCINN